MSPAVLKTDSRAIYEHVARSIADVLVAKYGREVDHDYDWALSFPYSFRRWVDVYIDGNGSGFTMSVWIYDPSQTVNHTDLPLEMKSAELDRFDEIQFQADLGRPAAQGGLASVHVEILVPSATWDAGAMAKMVMRLAGLVHMYT